MSIFSRAILIIALLVTATMARSEGIYNPTTGSWFSFSGGIGNFSGISNGKPSGGGGGCTPTGLKFNVACNTQYTTVIHF